MRSLCTRRKSLTCLSSRNFIIYIVWNSRNVTCKFNYSVNINSEEICFHNVLYIFSTQFCSICTYIHTQHLQHLLQIHNIYMFINTFSTTNLKCKMKYIYIYIIYFCQQKNIQSSLQGNIYAVSVRFIITRNS